MKHASTILAITLFLTASPSGHSGADHTRVDAAVWVNPDGSRGVAMTSAVPRDTLAWVNPDGAQGVMQRHVALGPMFEQPWVNPDGQRSVERLALSQTTKGPEVARYNNPPLYASKAEGPVPMPTFMLGMLVAGSMLLLAWRLWPH